MEPWFRFEMILFSTIDIDIRAVRSSHGIGSVGRMKLGHRPPGNGAAAGALRGSRGGCAAAAVREGEGVGLATLDVRFRSEPRRGADVPKCDRAWTWRGWISGARHRSPDRVSGLCARRRLRTRRG